MRRAIPILTAAVAIAAVAATTATARPAAAPTLSAAATTVSFGTQITLHGLVPGAAAGQEVQILTRACGFTGPVPIGTAKTTAGGTYTYALQPMLNATFFAQVGDVQSAGIPVRVKPTLQLRRVGAHMFAVDVSAGNGSWFTKSVVVQRYDLRTKRWTTLSTASLTAASDPGALIAVSSAKLHVLVKHGTQLRAFVPQSTVGSCYLPATSPTISS